MTCVVHKCLYSSRLTNLNDSPWIDFVEKIQHELHAYDIHNERKDSGQLKQKEYPCYKGHHIWSRKIIKKNLSKEREIQSKPVNNTHIDGNIESIRIKDVPVLSRSCYVRHTFYFNKILKKINKQHINTVILN